MKTVILASVILTLCIAAVFLNCVFVTASVDSLIEITERASSPDADFTALVSEFEREWNKCSFSFSIAVSSAETDKLELFIAKAKKQAEYSDTADVRVTFGELEHLLEGIKKSETFSAEGIL